MDARRIIEIIADIGTWKGDVYKLAYVVADEQKEASALLAEDAGQPDLAAAIRAG